MTKQRAIYLKCLDCAAGDRKEVLFCIIFDCSLWEYRCGYHISSSRYRERIERAFKRFTRIVAELQREGLDMPDFLRNDEQARYSKGNRKKKVKRYGGRHLPGEGSFLKGAKMASLIVLLKALKKANGAGFRRDSRANSNEWRSGRAEKETPGA